MSEIDAADAADNRALPQVRLVRRDEQTLVVPPKPRPDTVQPEPFAMPKVPKVLVDGLAMYCEMLRQRHERCAGILLLLEAKRREWTFRIPAQRCSRMASCWSVLRRDVPDVPEDALLCGTFQSRVLNDGEGPADAVPPVDGAHFVMAVRADDRAVWSYLRCGGRTELVQPQVVLFDDLNALLEESLSRMKFV